MLAAQIDLSCLQHARQLLESLKLSPEDAQRFITTESIATSRDDWGMDGERWMDLRNTGGTGLTAAPPTLPSDRSSGANWPAWRTDQDLNRLRARSRVLLESNAYAQGLIRNRVNYTIGKGFSYRAQSKDIVDADPDKPGLQTPEAIRSLVRKTQDVIDDFLRRNRWNGLTDPRATRIVTDTREREIYIRVDRDGEALVRCYRQESGRMLVRFIDPECVWNPPAANYRDGWSFGIQHQMAPFEDVETRLKYFAYYHTPSAVVITGKEPWDTLGEEIDAADVVHFVAPGTDSTIKRGIPFLRYDVAESLERAAKLQRCISAAAAVRACTSEIWQLLNATQAQASSLATDQASGTETDRITGQTRNIQRAIPGQIRYLSAGWENVPIPNDQSTPAYLQGVQGDLQQATSACAGPSYWTGDSTNGNYSSLETASAPAVKNGEAEQEYFKAGFSAVIWKAIAWAVECGLLPRAVLSVIDVVVEAPAVLHRNELEDAQVKQIEKQNGVLSPQTWCGEKGRDWEIEQANIEEANERSGGQVGALPLPDEEGNAPPEPPEPPAPPEKEPQPRMGLPEATLPDVRQSTNYSCGRAAALSVCKALGLSPTPEDLAAMGTTPQGGTDPDGLCLFFRQLGCEVTEGTMTPTTLGLLCAAGQPVLCPVQMHGGGHWIAVTGIDGDRVQYQDPSEGPSEMPLAEFVANWRDMDSDGEPYTRYGIAVARGK